MTGAPGAVRVRVPASTSNLGAGFDCVGMAVDRWLEVTADRGGAPDDPPVVTRAGTLAGLTIAPEADGIVRGFAAACAARGRAVPGGVRFAAGSEIPVGRGLGSSAAGVVAGAAAADAMLALGLDLPALLALCAALEGHPDNVTPALLGGATLTVAGDDGGLHAVPLAVHASLGFAFAIPAFGCETAVARRVLPETLPHRAAVRAAALGAALVAGLAGGDGTLLALALADVLHVPYRRALIRGYDAVGAAAERAGAFGATLSGSGSTMVAIAPRARAAAVAAAMVDAWRAMGVAAEPLACERPGAGYTVHAGG